MPAAWVAAAAAIAGVASNAKSASDANKANKASLASEEERIDALLVEIDKGRRAADKLREEREIPSEKFAQIARQYPQLLSSLLPGIERTTTPIANRLGENNADQFLKIRDKISPGSSALQADVLQQINEMNPENLGREEILALTRKLSPLLPVGTLDPNTGAVQGATANPVSLYRNLISGDYRGRRTEFVSAGSGYLGEQNNAAARQQVNAAEFLDVNLARGLSSSLALASADVAQQQADIDAQEAYIRLSASGLASQYDPTANNAVIAAGTKGATDSLSTAAAAIGETRYFKSKSPTV